ncbi:MAG: GNAT family N-acetyltransferase [Lachnospiraceae bacterium]|nr:GNAT family N-acetyltransferase [Lachnospiraceae bacterium]
MFETADLLIDKAKFPDWAAMYRNVWSHPESAQYMLWSITTSEEAARVRMQKTIEFQKTHNTYTVYDKRTGDAIGFAGFEQISPYTYEETGICLGPEFTGKGYGKQILECLIRYCKEDLGAKVFIYSTREANEASKRLACSLGFQMIGSEEKIDRRNDQPYVLQKYILKL